MAYNRYQGNTGRVVRVEEPERMPPSPPPPPPEPPRASAPGPRGRPPLPPGTLFGGLNGLFSGFGRGGGSFPGNILGSLETEDLLLIAILYLLYRESGDTEFLIILGAFLFL